MKGQTRILVAVGIGALGILLLVYASIQASARQYVRVHELAENSETYDEKRLKLSGEIMDDSVSYDPDNLTLRFKVKDVQGEGADQSEVSSTEDTPTSEIVYQGPKPDAFKEGGVAIVKGVYQADQNRIKASNLQAKCPSRYKENFEDKKSTDEDSSSDNPTPPTE